MKCPFCKEAIEDGASKCRYCQEYIIDFPSKKRGGYSKLKFTSDILKVCVWPLVVLLLLSVFHEDITSLLRRAKSFEIAGTKSEFSDYAAAFGYLQDKVGQLASEANPQARQDLKLEIENTAARLKGLHPLSLGLLIEIGRGVRRDDAWPENAGYVFDLQKRGFITLSPQASLPRDITKATTATLTPLGDSFLDSIGYTEHQHVGR